MEIITPSGKAEGQPLSDIQEYNAELKKNTKAIYIIGKKNTKAIYIIGFSLIGVLILLVAFGVLFADHFNLVDYIAYKFKGGC